MSRARVGHVVLLVLPLIGGGCATSAAVPEPASVRLDDATLLAEARAFYEAQVVLGNSHSPQGADAYDDHAAIRLVTYDADGTVRRTAITGAALKAMYPEMLKTVTADDVSEYVCTYRVATAAEALNTVFVDCLRHGAKKGDYAPAQYLLGRDAAGTWRFHADVSWVCSSPAACTKELPWAQLACAESKHWQDATSVVRAEDCDLPD